MRPHLRPIDKQLQRIPTSLIFCLQKTTPGLNYPAIIHSQVMIIVLLVRSNSKKLIGPSLFSFSFSFSFFFKCPDFTPLYQPVRASPLSLSLPPSLLSRRTAYRSNSYGERTKTEECAVFLFLLVARPDTPRPQACRLRGGAHDCPSPTPLLLLCTIPAWLNPTERV